MIQAHLLIIQQGGEKPYLVSGADDRSVKIWDYQNKTCVQTLEGHTQNVSAVCFHPEYPIIITGSEDGNPRLCADTCIFTGPQAPCESGTPTHIAWRRR